MLQIYFKNNNLLSIYIFKLTKFIEQKIFLIKKPKMTRGALSRRGGRGGKKTTTKTFKPTTTAATAGKNVKYVKRKNLASRKPRNDSANKEKKETESLINLDVNKDASEFFSKNASYDQHYNAQTINRDKYTATLMAFQDYSIEVIPNARARSLAAAFARRDKDLIEFLLNHNKQFGFVDVLKAVTILDSKREAASIEKKIARISSKTGSVIKPKKLGAFKNDINSLRKMQPKAGTFSGALARHIKRWVRKFTESELEYYALCLPTEPWKKLANIAHLNPEKDFPKAPWFLPFCFGAEPPAGSKVAECRKISKENVNELVAKFDLPYSLLKDYKTDLNDASKEKLAEKQEKLDTILWYYEDLACPKVMDIIRRRLENGDKIELGYGKLMERLLMFKSLKSVGNSTSLYSLLIPIAESDLKNFKSTIASPVAVLGDASGSMEVAIKTATIISSLLAAICSAKLTFFNHENFKSAQDPKTIADVLEVAHTTKATGSTAPAASLVPYFDSKEVVKTFIIVTDEEENADGTTKDGLRWRFYKLFMEYRKQVYPASLIFVSFLNSQHSDGQMYRDFVRDNVPDVLQFKFSRDRPDLTKLDTILGQICSKSSETFAGHVEKLESDIKTNGLIKAFDKLKPVVEESKPIVY